MSTPGTPWRPLLEGAEAARARRAIDAIATELARRSPELLVESPESHRAGLAGGAAGIALFFAYLAEVTGEEDHAGGAFTFLDQASELVAATVTPPDLYSGFTGVAWCLEHLEGRLFEGEEDGNAAIDEALESYLDNPSSAQEYDVIRGLAGLGIYALDRLRRPAAVRCLEKVVARLAETAISDTDGVRWFTPPERLPPHQREVYPDGSYNLGVAHGLPGVLPVLAGAVAAGVAAKEAGRLLDGAVAWLLAQELAPEAGSCFPYAVAPGRQAASSRLAWCYGDPGIAAALLCAARALGREDWRRQALQVALAAAARGPQTAGVRDAGLCHGSAGLGHLFNRLGQTGGGERLAEAARFWLGRCLDFAGEGHGGIAGFASWSPARDDPEELGWRDDAGFLTGAAGVGLALLAAVSEVPPDWDRVLALSLPPL